MTTGPKRFYEAAATRAEGDAFAVTLDGRTAKTPGRRVLAGPAPLAEAMAAEWAGQGDTLDMAEMPLTRLQGRFLDADEATRAGWVDTLVTYAGTDLLCYRGEDPGLAKRQADVWQPYLDRVGEALNGRFAVTEGIVAVQQDDDLLASLRAFAEARAPAERYALSLLTEITGSAVLALAVLLGEPPAKVFAASRLDERFQAERWGEDAEAQARESRLEQDFRAAARFWTLA